MERIKIDDRLTDHQDEVLGIALDKLLNTKRLLIKGSAGVGKTFLADILINKYCKDRVKKPSSNVYCSAPTHKALSILRGKVHSDRVEFITIQAVLKLKRKIDFKTGAVTFESSYSKNKREYEPLYKTELLIIDEVSMINKQLLAYIEKYATKNDTTVIFIGDSKQINPVGEDDSPVFTANYPEVELTEIVRQGVGNPIIELSRHLEVVEAKESHLTEEGKGFIYTKNMNKIIERLSEVNGSDEFKYLAWTNKDVDYLNNLVRKNIYGNPKKIEIGESLIFNAPYGELYNTNEEIKVHDVEVITESFVYSFNKGYSLKKITKDNPKDKTIKLKCYSINPRRITFLGKPKCIHDILVIHEDSEEEYKKVLTLLKKRCQLRLVDWKDYYNFMENFADFKYNHAISVHKSQGSTYKNAIVNMNNLFLNKNKKERERLLYTAVTRASDLLIIYNH